VVPRLAGLDPTGTVRAVDRILEPFGMVWINQALFRGKGRNWAFVAVAHERARHHRRPPQGASGREKDYEIWLERHTRGEAATLVAIVASSFTSSDRGQVALALDSIEGYGVVYRGVQGAAQARHRASTDRRQASSWDGVTPWPVSSSA
jgi:hypothetical protein